MLSSEILDATALEQAALVRRGQVTSEEIVEIYLERVAEENPRTYAFVEALGTRVIAEARHADRRRRQGEQAPFLGVPTAIKDLNLAKGAFTRFGSRAFEKFYSVSDDATTAQLRLGGFLVLGKSATSELGSLPVTEPDIHPPTRNPWNLDFTPGGSSGGAGAAVAARMVPIAQGSDAAGSIRIPSSFCHLFGIKPSRGRVENSYGQDDKHIIYSCGPIARTVDDAAAMLDVMAGISVGKPHWAPAPAMPFAELAKRPPKRLRVRWASKNWLTETDPEVALAVERMAKLLAGFGHDVEEGTIMPGSVEEFLPVWQRIAALAPVHDWSLTQPVTRWLAEQGANVTDAEVLRLTSKLEAEVLAWFGDVDIWLTPTVAVAPPKIGAWKGLTPPEVFAQAAKLGVFTAAFNVSGQPAASVPAGLSKAGLPIGVQLAGRPLEDGTVLAVARQIEEAAPWRTLRPPAAPAK
jgi:amidase